MEIRFLNPGTESQIVKLTIVIDRKTYEVEYDNAGDTIELAEDLADRAQSLVLPDPGTPSDEHDLAKVLRSPVAGIVTRINVEAGQPLRANEVLIVVEAMKMENNLTGPSAGTVAAVKVRVGETVKVGQVLIEFS